MEIIQSFSLFDEGYFNSSSELNRYEKYLHFYTFFLSFLTLKKYNGAVTMYCNQAAYDTFIRFIPYDKIIIQENKYEYKFWSAYKLSVIENITTPFIHVDSDVFIFNDIFRPYIDNLDKYDIMVQYKFDYTNDNSKQDYEYHYNEICNIEKYDNMSFTCGVLGISNLDIRDKYIYDTKIVYDKILSNEIIGNNAEIGFYLEEHTLYLSVLEYNLKYYEILPYDEIKQTTLNEVCLKKKYTHMWSNSKFKEKNINMILNKIKELFPEKYYYVDEYERHLTELNIKKIYHP